MEKEFAYLGVPIKVGFSENEMPYVDLPDSVSGLTQRLSVVDLTINFGGRLIFRIKDDLLNSLGEVIDRASVKPISTSQSGEDYTYFFGLDIGGQPMGDAISKQLINGILENTPLKINCFSWAGEFLQPISVSAVYDVDQDRIDVTKIDHDENIVVEFSYDGGVTWVEEDYFAAPGYGTHTILARYKDKELRKGKAFRMVLPVSVTIESPEEEDDLSGEI